MTGRAEHGYSMVIVMMVLLVGTIASVGAWSAAQNDVPASRESVDGKRAYAAAEAGLADYLQKLSTDNEYWLKCTTVARLPDNSPAPVNQAWNGAGTDPRVWRALPGRRSTAYTIELLPRSPYPQCQPNVDASMMESGGTIQLRVTGKAGTGVGERRRSIIATLRRNGFLDFLYFTEYEESDPTQKELDTGGYPVKRCAPNQSCAIDDIAAWADSPSTCRRFVREGRSSVRYPGSISTDGGRTWQAYPLGCGSIQFLGTDANNGPLHSNDTISICGQPKFGRNRSGNTGASVDRIEYYDYDQTCSGGGPNNGNNAVLTGDAMPILQLPDSNAQLRTTAQQGGILYSGQTTITLKGTRMDVVTGGVSYANVALPANGVLFVRNATTGSCPRFSPRTPYATGQTACGDVFVSGTYGAGLTIAADRDIVVTGDVTGSNNALLGLIANNFVRVYHPVKSYPCTKDTQESTTIKNRRIEAAILSLGHVFTVDNYQCGDPLGGLQVKGAIAQRYRGPVGTHSSGSVVTGFSKDYAYDDRLKYRSPPYFLAPVQSAWRAVRSTEQVPPR